MRTPLNLIDEVTVTNSELIKVLIQLGYRDESSDRKYRFVNDSHNSIVELPLRTPEEAVRKVDLDIYSYRLYMQGVTQQEENLIRKIQKNRVGNQTALAM
jgi:hypothetical protein